MIPDNLIANFSCDEEKFSPYKKNNWNINGKGKIFTKGELENLKINLNFNNTVGCKLFLGKNVVGNLKIKFKNNHSTIWIGNSAKLGNLEIRSFQKEDLIAIGNFTSVSYSCTFISGNNAGSANPSIIIGDDCMFSNDIVIRNTDAHPIIDRSHKKQINQPHGSVIIEPHVWIGERAIILKDLKIGACSIIGLGSILTKDIPRFSVVGGVPARIIRQNNNHVWSRNMNKGAIDKAEKYAQMFDNDNYILSK